MKRIIKSVIIDLLPADVLSALFIWGMLIVARASGSLMWPWWIVLTCGTELLLGAFFANVLLCVIIAPLLYLKDYIKRRNRRRKTDKRIIAQAKAAGVWDKPYILGGRALELKAWEDFRIKRRVGELDVMLRVRYREAAVKEYEKRKANSKDGKSTTVTIIDENHTERG